MQLMRNPFTVRVSVYGRALSPLGPYSPVHSHIRKTTKESVLGLRRILIFSQIFAIQESGLFLFLLKVFLVFLSFDNFLQVQDLPS